MDFTLSEEQVMLRNMARQFAANAIEPVAAEDDRNEHFRRETISEMAGLGFLGALVPQEYGGSALDHLSYAILVEEIARASPSVAMSVFYGQAIVAEALARWGSSPQKQKYLASLTQGEILGCHNLGRPQQEAKEIRCQRRDNGWTLEGTNSFVVNGGMSQLGLILAGTNDSPSGLGIFIVEPDTSGFASNSVSGKTGLRAADIAELRLNQCRVRSDSILENVDSISKIAEQLLDSVHFSVAAICVGASQSCADAGISYAQQRRAFGKPIGELGMVQDMIAEMVISAETARLQLYQAAALRDRQQPFRQQLFIARYLAGQAALQSANQAIQVHGCYGYEKRTSVERYFRDVTLATLYGGTLPRHKLAIARYSLGLQPTG